jgi:hypothetical protein
MGTTTGGALAADEEGTTTLGTPSVEHLLMSTRRALPPADADAVVDVEMPVPSMGKLSREVSLDVAGCQEGSSSLFEHAINSSSLLVILA